MVKHSYELKKIDSNTSGKSITGISVNHESYANTDSDIKVYVRYKATQTSSASLPPRLLPIPTGTID